MNDPKPQPSCCALRILEDEPSEHLIDRMVPCQGCGRIWFHTMDGFWKELQPAAPEAKDEVMDKVVPSHYTSHAVTPIDLIVAYGLNFALGNVIKYAARAAEKDGRADLMKSLWYIVFELTQSTDTANRVCEDVRAHLTPEP